MRRYPDLERQILLAVEADDGDLRGFADLSGVADHSAHQTSYQVMLLHEASLLYAIDVTTLEAGYDWKPLRLTMAGHEYLETIRDPEIWRKTQDGAGKVGSFSLDVLGTIARGLIRTKIETHTGVKIDL